MDHSTSRGYSLRHGLVLLTFVIPSMLLAQTITDRFDAAGQTVTYYPASMYLSHSPCALAFVSNTKLVHIGVILKPLPVGPEPSFKTSCTRLEKESLTTLLTSTAGVHRPIKQLLSVRFLKFNRM